MADQVEIQIPKTVVPERTNFTATAYFRTRSTKAADTPTTVHYRIDNAETRENIQPWTSVSASSSVNISITPTHNQIKDSTNPMETRVLIVAADKDTTTQAVGRVQWKVKNLIGLT